MCYWELTKFSKNHYRKWVKPAKRNKDGYGYFCLSCMQQFKAKSYKEFSRHISVHNKHVVLVHFRLKSCGEKSLFNVQPLVRSGFVFAHNGDISNLAYSIDWRRELNAGASDSNVAATYIKDTLIDNKDQGVMETILNIFKEFSENDFIGNYVFVNEEFVIVSLGSGEYSKKPFSVNTGGVDYQQLVFRTEDLLKGRVKPVYETFEDYTRVWSSYTVEDRYDNETYSIEYVLNKKFSNDGELNEYIYERVEELEIKSFYKKDLVSIIEDIVEEYEQMYGYTFIKTYSYETDDLVYFIGDKYEFTK